MGGNPNAVKGGTGKAEAAKLQDAGISPKQWPKKMSGRKGWLTRLDESQYDGRTTSTCETKKTVANVRVSAGWLWEMRSAIVTIECVTATRWKLPMT
jgi:hypothetical protein